MLERRQGESVSVCVREKEREKEKEEDMETMLREKKAWFVKRE